MSRNRLFPMLFCLLLAGPALAGSTPPDGTEPPPAESPATAPIRWFRAVVSQADGERCPMTPSCSTYALQAIARHGPLRGWIMTCDRLLRCGHDELHLSPSVMTGSGPRCHDPVEKNDFWWP